MDELQKKVDALTKELETAKAQSLVATKERDDLKTSAEKLAKDLKKKDEIIEQKNKDLVGQRQQYKKLSERPKEELDGMSDAEKESIKRQEEHDAKMAQLEKENKEFRDKEVTSRRESVIKRIVGNNPDIRKKFDEKLALINPELLNKAQTEDELAPLISDAYGMLGIAKPNPLTAAMGGQGNAPAEGQQSQNFADTPEGQAMFNRIAPPAVLAAEAAKK